MRAAPGDRSVQTRERRAGRIPGEAGQAPSSLLLETPLGKLRLALSLLPLLCRPRAPQGQRAASPALPAPSVTWGGSVWLSSVVSTVCIPRWQVPHRPGALLQHVLISSSGQLLPGALFLRSPLAAL